MQKINCIIIDDSALARNLLERHISQIADFQLIKTFENGVEANIFLQKEAIDLVFCDIEMPKINGIDFIKNLEPKPFVVFTTAYSEYAVEGFELGAVDYLLKPITFERFSLAIERALKLLKTQQVEQNRPNESIDSIFVKSNGRQIKISFDDIIYIEANGDYINIYTPQKRIVTYERMKNILQQLPENQFFRTHNSYIINKNKVTTIYTDKVELGDVTLPISEKKRVIVRRYFSEK